MTRTQPHDHDHDHEPVDPNLSAEEFWEPMYTSEDRRWSGRANGVLVDQVSGLTPGRALDLGCGEGGDAVWLAEQGWTVTAVDVAPSALARGADAARERGVADRIDWQRHDLSETFPDGEFELVTNHYLHSPVGFPRTEVLRKAAQAVVPGGVFLVVGHAESPPWARHAHHDNTLMTAEEELAELTLDPDEWEVELAANLSREATGPGGVSGTLLDSVVRVRRRATG